jgi:hypothetical protein
MGTDAPGYSILSLVQLDQVTPVLLLLLLLGPSRGGGEDNIRKKKVRKKGRKKEKRPMSEDPACDQLFPSLFYSYYSTL